MARYSPALTDAQRAVQRQRGRSCGPAGRAEPFSSIPTAGCLNRPSCGASVDHQAGACGSAQQRRDQLHHARAASEAGPDLQAVSAETDCARERSIGREHRWCFIGPLRAAARRWSRAEPVSAACGIFRRGRACGGRGRRRAACDPGSGRLGRAGRSAAVVGRTEFSQPGGAPFASLSTRRLARSTSSRRAHGLEWVTGLVRTHKSHTGLLPRFACGQSSRAEAACIAYRVGASTERCGDSRRGLSSRGAMGTFFFGNTLVSTFFVQGVSHPV